MEKVLDKAGVIIIRFLADSDLEVLICVSSKFKEISESALLWRSLLASFNPRSNKYMHKDIRIRVATKRPEPKPKLTMASETILSKQWVFIPPDLERQIKLITINKAGQLRKNEEFSSRCLQVLETWAESISRTLNILESQETRGETSDPSSVIVFWKDKIKIIEEIMVELNDICVAKVDAVFNATVPHKRFVSQIERVKKQHREAKVKLYLDCLDGFV